MASSTPALEEAFREYWAVVVSALARTLRDWDLAEECAQEAFAVAADSWAERGLPDSPVAWLISAAKNKAIDRIRRDHRYAANLEEIAHRLTVVGDEQVDPGTSYRDERLALIFACCHPDLGTEASLCLTLRYVSGINTKDLARAFLISDEAMSKRLTRAKRRIREADISISIPPDDQLKERLELVLRVLYQMFTEGYSVSQESAMTGLRAEAIFLGRYLVVMFPGEPEVRGLQSLMLFQEARSPARVSADEILIPLEEQDREIVDQPLVEEAQQLLEEALVHRQGGPYLLQAAIASCHAHAKSYDKTNWAQICALYGELLRHWDTPVVHLNRAVAMSNLVSPMVAPDLLDQVAEGRGLTGYYLFHATRADLLRRAGRTEEARAEYETAGALTTKVVEKRYLRRRLLESLQQPPVDQFDYPVGESARGPEW